MQEAEYFNSRIVAENFERVTYNAFINSEIKPINEKIEALQIMIFFQLF